MHMDRTRLRWRVQSGLFFATRKVAGSNYKVFTLQRGSDSSNCVKNRDLWRQRMPVILDTPLVMGKVHLTDRTRPGA